MSSQLVQNGSPDQTGDSTPAAGALDLAMQIAGSLLAAGMSANDVALVALRITRTYGLERVHVDVTYTSISASYYPALGVPPITCVRIVQPGVIDYGKVRALDRLSIEIGAGLPLREAATKFSNIRAARRRYPWWVSMLGNAGVGVGSVLLFSTSWQILLITLMSGCLLDRVLAGLERVRMPPFFSQCAGAAMMTLIAVGATAAGRGGVKVLSGLDPTLIVVRRHRHAGGRHDHRGSDAGRHRPVLRHRLGSPAEVTLHGEASWSESSLSATCVAAGSAGHDLSGPRRVAPAVLGSSVPGLICAACGMACGSGDHRTCRGHRPAWLGRIQRDGHAGCQRRTGQCGGGADGGTCRHLRHPPIQHPQLCLDQRRAVAAGSGTFVVQRSAAAGRYRTGTW